MTGKKRSNRRDKRRRRKKKQQKQKRVENVSSWKNHGRSEGDK